MLPRKTKVHFLEQITADSGPCGKGLRRNWRCSLNKLCWLRSDLSLVPRKGGGGCRFQGASLFGTLQDEEGSPRDGRQPEHELSVQPKPVCMGTTLGQLERFRNLSSHRNIFLIYRKQKQRVNT